MSVISIRLPETLLHELDIHAKALHMQRTTYIREAVRHMNEENTLNLRKSKLKQASMRVRNASMRVNAEFDKIEHDPEV